MLSEGPTFWKLVVPDCGEGSVEINNVTLSKGKFQSSSLWVHTPLSYCPNNYLLSLSCFLDSYKIGLMCVTAAQIFLFGKAVSQMRLMHFVNALQFLYSITESFR